MTSTRKTSAVPNWKRRRPTRKCRFTFRGIDVPENPRPARAGRGWPRAGGGASPHPPLRRTFSRGEKVLHCSGVKSPHALRHPPPPPPPSSRRRGADGAAAAGRVEQREDRARDDALRG